MAVDVMINTYNKIRCAGNGNEPLPPDKVVIDCSSRITCSLRLFSKIQDLRLNNVDLRLVLRDR
ncbi:hypothetical protein C5167_031247 [Papaver somniferum]|nr:hypothetical protein C5167_031247 [Papaver somniferum]